MLIINVKGIEYFDEKQGMFIEIKDQTLELEHSLFSVSKWEEKWHKAFLGKEEKTLEETLDYIRCMTLTPNVDPLVYQSLTTQNLTDIYEYIENPMTATVIYDNAKGGRRTITAELIYYWMIASNIPFECQYWHLKKLLTLIRVCNIESNPPKKMSNKELLNRNRALNAARRQRLNTKG